MIENRESWKDPRQYVLRFVLFPVVLLIGVWFSTDKDLRATLVLLTLVLILNLLYWIIRLLERHAKAIGQRLAADGRNPFFNAQNKNDE